MSPGAIPASPSNLSTSKLNSKVEFPKVGPPHFPYNLSTFWIIPAFPSNLSTSKLNSKVEIPMVGPHFPYNLSTFEPHPSVQ